MPPPRLNDGHKEFIEAILKHAIARNETFDSFDTIADCLKASGFEESLLHTESKDTIFNIYLNLRNSTQSSPSRQQQPRQSSQQSIQTVSSSPTSTSPYGEPAPNPAKTILEEFEGRDDVEPPNFLDRVSHSSEQIAVYPDKLGSLPHYHLPSSIP